METPELFVSGIDGNPWNTQTFDALATATSHVLEFEITRGFGDPPLVLDSITATILPNGQPVVSVRKPGKLRRLTRARVRLRGVAASLLPLSSVTVLTRGRAIPASVSGSAWSRRIRAARGVSFVVVTATDLAGTESAPLRVRMRRRSRD